MTERVLIMAVTKPRVPAMRVRMPRLIWKGTKRRSGGRWRSGPRPRASGDRTPGLDTCPPTQGDNEGGPSHPRGRALDRDRRGEGARDRYHDSPAARGQARRAGASSGEAQDAGLHRRPGQGATGGAPRESPARSEAEARRARKLRIEPGATCRPSGKGSARSFLPAGGSWKGSEAGTALSLGALLEAGRTAAAPAVRGPTASTALGTGPELWRLHVSKRPTRLLASQPEHPPTTRS